MQMDELDHVCHPPIRIGRFDTAVESCPRRIRDATAMPERSVLSELRPSL
jgi:hypothetical protein